MPVLRRFNPRIEEAIGRVASAAAGESAYFDQLARAYFLDIASISANGGVSISRRDLLAVHPAMARRLIRLALKQARGVVPDIEAVHIEALLNALEMPPGSYSLPAGLAARIDQHCFIVDGGSPPLTQEIPETKLALPGKTTAGDWTISAEITAVPPRLSEIRPEEVYLDIARIGRDLTVRSRRPSDRLCPLGLGGEKKLQDIFVDAKVPARERDGIPIVCAGGRIAWVVGHCIDERFALMPDTKQVLHLRARSALENDGGL